MTTIRSAKRRYTHVSARLVLAETPQALLRARAVGLLTIFREELPSDRSAFRGAPMEQPSDQPRRGTSASQARGAGIASGAAPAGGPTFLASAASRGHGPTKRRSAPTSASRFARTASVPACRDASTHGRIPKHPAREDVGVMEVFEREPFLRLRNWALSGSAADGASYVCSAVLMMQRHPPVCRLLAFDERHGEPYSLHVRNECSWRHHRCLRFDKSAVDLGWGEA